MASLRDYQFSSCILRQQSVIHATSWMNENLLLKLLAAINYWHRCLCIRHSATKNLYYHPGGICAGIGSRLSRINFCQISINHLPMLTALPTLHLGRFLHRSFIDAVKLKKSHRLFFIFIAGQIPNATYHATRLSAYLTVLAPQISLITKHLQISWFP